MKTKSLSEICQLVKDEYVIRSHPDGNVYNGMCFPALWLRRSNKLTYKEYDKFSAEYDKFTKNRRVFYYYSGEKVSSKLYFAWPIQNRAARIKWLDQRI